MMKICLNAKYKFLREAVAVKKELGKYSQLARRDHFGKIAIDTSFSREETSKRVCGSLAAWSHYFNLRDAETAYCGGLEKAKETLETLRDDNKKYGWGIK